MENRRRWLLIALWLLACAWLVARRWDAISTVMLPDSDDALRLLQVRDWIGGQGWFDLRQYRLAPPAGADIHWSRLVDLPLAGSILGLRPLLGAAAAEQVAVVAVPLVALLGAMTLAARVARDAIAPDAWWWGPAMLLMATPAIGMLSPLRIDHHGWQIVALLALIHGLIDPRARRGGLTAGVATAGSLAIGVEMLPYLALGTAMAAAGWVADPQERDRLRWLAVSASLLTIAALFVFVPPVHRWSGCDALSIAYALPILFGGAAAAIATGLPLSSLRARLAALACMGAAAALGLSAGGAQCMIDPYAAIDPQARRLWLGVVAESMPLARQTSDVAVATLILPLIGLAGALWMAWRGSARRAWLLLSALSLASIALTLASTRAGTAAQALAVPGAAALGFLGRAWLARSGSPVVRVFGSVALFLLVSGLAPRILVAATLGTSATPREQAEAKANVACLTPASLRRLDTLPAGVALAFIDATPALLLHTHHSGLAGPYHRNGAAIVDVMRAWAGRAAEARAMLARRRVRYVMICGAMTEGAVYRRRGPDGFYARLSAGRVPDWLAPAPNVTRPWRVWIVRP